MIFIFMGRERERKGKEREGTWQTAALETTDLISKQFGTVTDKKRFRGAVA